MAKKGAKHVYSKKLHNQSHKTLMLTICGNGTTLKHLIILEKSFPLVGHEEGDSIPEKILLSKTFKGSMEQSLFVVWLEKCVLPHKSVVNPDEKSLLIIDNHPSRHATYSNVESTLIFR